MSECNILILEDMPSWSKILKNYIQIALDNLGEEGDIQVIDNLQEAWDIFERSEGWSLLCADIRLSEKGFNKEGALLVSRAAEREIPTVIVSGSPKVTQQDVRDFFKKDNIEDFFSKNSFDSKMFVGVVEKLLTNTKRPTSRCRVFICYAHADNEDNDPKKCWLNRFRKFLEPLVRQEDITVFSDKDVTIGEHWHEKIQHELNNSSSAVLLVSQNFLASDYIANSEMPVLLKNAADKDLRIFPIIISPCSYERITFRYTDPKDGPKEFKLSSLQSANPPSMTLMDMNNEADQDRVLLEVAEQLSES